MIPYYSPNLSLVKVLSALFCNKTEENIKNYFAKLTGKKYILLTNSCRSALFLTYKVLKNKGAVITTPLTCNSALVPIKYSGNTPYYVDISKDSLNIDTNQLHKIKISGDFVAVQVIHLGGIPCDMENICLFANEKKLMLVEDCAQGFGSSIGGKSVGSWGDVACFSLIKNVFGISGGILATNSQEIYSKAKQIQNDFPPVSLRLLIFRIIRNIIETNRKYIGGELIYLYFMVIRNLIKGNTSSSEYKDLKKSLKKPRELIFKIAWSQLKNIDRLINQRAEKGLQILNELTRYNIAENYNEIDFNNYRTSFVKFYVYNSRFNVPECIEQLNNEGVEAKHLEHKYQIYYQTRLDNNELLKDQSLKRCTTYLLVHEHLISLPLFEQINNNQINELIGKLKQLL